MTRRVLQVFAWALVLLVGLMRRAIAVRFADACVDASGAVVVGAAVTAVNEATNETRTTTSGDAGAFALAELAPGAWRVEIGAPGHKTHVAARRARRESRAARRCATGGRCAHRSRRSDRRRTRICGAIRLPWAPSSRTARSWTCRSTAETFSSSRCSRPAPPLPRRDPRAPSAAISRSASTAAGRTSTASCSTAPTTSIQS